MYLDLVGNTLTISGVIGRDTNEKKVILQKADASNGYQLAHSATGQLLFELRIGRVTKTVTSTTLLPLNDWRHIAARYDGSELRVFIDGASASGLTPEIISAGIRFVYEILDAIDEKTLWGCR